MAINPIPQLIVAGVLLPMLAHSQNAEQLYQSGTRFFAENKPESAISALQEAVRLQPNHGPAWKALGVVHASRGDFESAEKPFRNACEIRPAVPDACLYYGRTLYLLDRFQPAIQILQRTLAAAENAETWRLIGLCEEGLGRTAEAGAAFRKALGLTRGSPRGSAPDEDPGIDYGVFLFRQGQAAEAIAPLENALERHADSARAHLELGCILLALDRLAAAAGHLERAVALNPASARSHLLLGKTYLRLGRPDAAEEHLRQGSRTVK